MTPEEKIQSLIDAADEVTGQSSSNLTSAVQGLINGYEGVTDVQVNGSSVVSSGVANITLPNYSTTEQDTGRKWINGETIYQKTYQGTTNPSYSAGSVTIDSFAGKNFLHGYGWCGQYSASSRIGVPAYLGIDYYSGLYYDEAGDNLVLFYSRGLANSSYEITIFYTKTP